MVDRFGTVLARQKEQSGETPLKIENQIEKMDVNADRI